jgi:hypothetical protein
MNLKSIGLTVALMGMIVFVPPSGAQNPGQCEINCAIAARLAIRACSTRQCVADVRAALEECVSGCTADTCN